MDFLFSDKLGSTVFAPVKMDFVGNIKVCVIHLLSEHINDYITICISALHLKHHPDPKMM